MLFLFWTTLLLGFLCPAFWLVTFGSLVVMIFQGGGEKSYNGHKVVVTEQEYREKVRFYKKHGGDYDAFMLKLRPDLPIPGKP